MRVNNLGIPTPFPGLIGAVVKIADGPSAGRSTTTADNGSGTYLLAGLSASSFTIIVSFPGLATQTIPVTLTSNQVLNVVLSYVSIALTGQVTDADTSAPLSGATVYINGRYTGTTDGSGHYIVNGFLDFGAGRNFAWVGFPEHEAEYRLIQGTSQDFHVRPIQRISAGTSTSVTVAPTDTLCLNNEQDFTFGGQMYACRTVRVVAPSDGLVTVEAVSPSGDHPVLEVEIPDLLPCCSEGLGNPSSRQVTAGTEIVVHVEIPVESVTSQTFVLKTSISGAASGLGRQ